MRAVFVVLVVLLAGCGSAAPEPKPVQPKLPRAPAQELLVRARAVEDALARNDGCATSRALASLQQTTSALVEAGRVPRAFRAHLRAAVRDLASRPVPACEPPPPPPTPVRGKGKGHVKHRHGHGNEGGDE
jgi:hypothetical protein